ncbi:glycosyl hydrolase family 28-related protein [Parapedobacter lycopersici]|uniref:glycosyl hydrolase family 28-related protein n=1 Tax=Parapedobacter lycopersici TaxID=1864939 RepID=UPI00333F2340
MMNLKTIWAISFFLWLSYTLQAQSVSVYTEKPDDDEAVFFTGEQFGVRNDGSMDVSDILQKAIIDLKNTRNFGILFIPEGTYKLTKTIYIPKAIRLIGYGSTRPEFILAANSPGFQQPRAGDKGAANYLFWFVDRYEGDDEEIRDAGAGTFYSALSNVNLRIADGNPSAVALRTHFAQHSFISHVDIHAGTGKAGLYDVGNEMENVRFYGGDYGIYTTKTSPGWPMMMVDTYFEGQRKAAIATMAIGDVGLTIVNMEAKNTPVVIEATHAFPDKIFLENCRFENISRSALVFNEYNAKNQISALQVACRNVPVFATIKGTDSTITRSDNMYRVNRFVYGLHIADLGTDAQYQTIFETEALSRFPERPVKEIPDLPPMSEWVNIKALGAVGDGVTDDTEVFRKALATHRTIYVPQGWYVISEPLKMDGSTKLIGLHPFATQLMLKESTLAFSGFGGPVALLESASGGQNMLNGIGLNTGAYNYRAVGLKWTAGADSYVNDVKFVGGHGTMPKGNAPQQAYANAGARISTPGQPVVLPGMDAAWDNQYWSFWVTNGGGGIFKDIWTASTYNASGLYVSNTETPGKIYAMSLEHHVRNEARFNNVANWKMYAFQFEEESREGHDVLPLELVNCRDLMFAHLYFFRVIRMVKPAPYSARTWNCENLTFYNVHNYSQIKYTTNVPIYDVNTGMDVRPWEFSMLHIKGNRCQPPTGPAPEGIRQVATGFEFAEGITRDSRGNIYFSDHRLRRIYKWSVATESVSLVADFPWKPLSLGVDTKDNLLVVFRYDPQPGYLVNGEQETVPALPDAAGTSFSGWGNSGFASWVYSVDPDNPDESIRLLPKVRYGAMKNIHKLLLPANRWRMNFEEVSVFTPEYAFAAPDGVTYIPEFYDLARATGVVEAFPGKNYYSTDEYYKKVARVAVGADGTFNDVSYVINRGEFSTVTDDAGNVYVADGQIHVYNPAGERIRTIDVPERPATLIFGGKDNKTLFITARSSLYSIHIP